MLIQTNNVEDPIFDSDELAERLGIGSFSKEGFIEWFQFYDPLQAAGVNVDDEDGVIGRVAKTSAACATSELRSKNTVASVLG